MCQGLLIIEASRSHWDTPHPVGLLWTSDQPVTGTSTWQHTALTRNRHPRLLRASNPPSPSKKTSANRRLRTRGHWERRFLLYLVILYQRSAGKLSHKQPVPFSLHTADQLLRGVGRLSATHTGLLLISKCGSFFSCFSILVLSECGFAFQRRNADCSSRELFRD
jgi:hypothetical protein